MRDALTGGLDAAALRADREARARAASAGEEVVDSTRALLVWEPRRVVPSFAVPVEDVRGELVPAPARRGGRIVAAPAPAPGHRLRRALDRGRGLRPAHGPRRMREGVAFAPADPDLAGHVILDFTGFDAWYEEDEPILGHPRDPYHRVDMRRSSRHVRVERNGELLAESSRAMLLFETGLPTRFYLPREDVRLDAAPERQADVLPLQGPGVVLVVRAGRARAPGPGLELRGPAAGGRGGDRPRRLLRRARRRRRSTASAARGPAPQFEGDRGRGRDQRRIGSPPWRPATCSRPSRRRRPRMGSCSGAGVRLAVRAGPRRPGARGEGPPRSRHSSGR